MHTKIRSACAMFLAALLGAAAPAPARDAGTPPMGWETYGPDARGDRYSPLHQIDRSNVRRLEKAWQFDIDEKGDAETNPLIVGRTLFGFTPGLKVFALDAASGERRWLFDPAFRGASLTQGVTFTGPSRGLAYWHEGKERRLLAGIMNRLYALDPGTGRPIDSFGEHGFVDLRKDLRGDYREHYVSMNSPGVIYKDLVIVGFGTSETEPAPPGDIRAYDVRSGALRWTFHTIPRAGEFGAETWPADAWKTAGAANNWGGMALDRARGIVYAPTGSAVSDFYGADRVGDDLFANTLLALDAATGKRLWHFQGVHHDLWDRDFPAPPSLVTLHRERRVVDAVVAPTKQGYLYVFDRVTGAPVFPIQEFDYPASEVPGEHASRTQPRPLVPEPIARQMLTEEMLTNRTPEAHDWAVRQFRSFHSGGQFVPFGVKTQTVVFPGFDGGAEWGGAAVDPRTGVLYINANDVAWTGGLTQSIPGEGLGASLYADHCAVCHGADRQGSAPNFPSLKEVAAKLSADQITETVRNGRGRMPSFASIKGPSMAALVSFVMTGAEDPAQSQREATRADGSPGAQTGMAQTDMQVYPFADPKPGRYRFTGYNKFLDPEGYPAVAPPWGTLNAIDLNTGRYLWKIPLGEYPELAAQGLHGTGTENYGGPIVTAGGLVFIGATIYDDKIRAFDSSSGALLWEADLPYAGTATPATYSIEGRQFVVISTSNARKPNAKQGGAYVAFALK